MLISTTAQPASFMMLFRSVPTADPPLLFGHGELGSSHALNGTKQLIVVADPYEPTTTQRFSCVDQIADCNTTKSGASA